MDRNSPIYQSRNAQSPGAGFHSVCQITRLKERTILFKHALPNGIATAMVAITFGVSAAILIESGLSFLGIGVEPGTVTWGMLLSEGRTNFSAWWLVVFPGLAIFATVTALNFIGEALREVLDPR